MRDMLKGLAAMRFLDLDFEYMLDYLTLERQCKYGHQGLVEEQRTAGPHQVARGETRRRGVRAEHRLQILHRQHSVRDTYREVNKFIQCPLETSRS